MGYRLYREVKDHAPADLGPAELLLLLLVADDANEHTRTSYAGREELIAWLRVGGWNSVQKILNRLGRRGVELRVPIGKDRNGCPVYARAGRKSVYRVPMFAATTADGEPVDNSAQDGQPSALETGQGGRSSALRADNGPHHEDNRPHHEDNRPPHLLNPHPSSLSVPARLVRAAAVVDERDETDFVEWITTTHEPRGNGWWVKVAENGDLAALADQWRAELSGSGQSDDAPPRPVWCGQCNERTRLVEDDDGRPSRCRRCHPLVAGDAA